MICCGVRDWTVCWHVQDADEQWSERWSINPAFKCQWFTLDVIWHRSTRYATISYLQQKQRVNSCIACNVVHTVGLVTGLLKEQFPAVPSYVQTAILNSPPVLTCAPEVLLGFGELYSSGPDCAEGNSKEIKYTCSQVTRGRNKAMHGAHGK